MKHLSALVFCLLISNVVTAAPISIYTAPDQTYQNGGNNPCLFAGTGGGGCNNPPVGFPTWTTDTGNGGFTPYPLVNSIGDVAGELASFALNIGRDFYLGLDINDTTNDISDAQTLDNLTINFFNSLNVNIGSYTFAPATAVLSNANGNGYADFILTAGCAGTTTGSGVTATCTPTVPNGPSYSPFIAPVGTRRIDFTFGLVNFNDGADKLFLIPKLTDGVVTPLDDDDVVVTATPEPGSLLLLGTGLLGLGYTAARRRKY